MAQLLPESQGIEQTPLGAAWRFRWLVLMLTLIGAGMAFLYASGTATTEYEATASLVVSDPRTSTLFSADDAARNATLYVEDQIAILRSDSVAQRASELLTDEGIDVHPLVIAASIRIYTTTGNEILIQYTDADERVAIEAVNALVSAYGEVRSESAVRDSASAIAQLDQSLTAMDIEVAGIEADINDIRASSVAGQMNQQYEEALARIVVLQAQLETAGETELEAVRAELTDLDLLLNRLIRVSSIEENDPELVRLYTEQSQAISRRSQLAQQRDQLLVDTELLSGGISLSSPAQFAIADTTDVVTITILGGLLGLLAGAGFAYLLALRRRKFGERAQPGWVLETSMLAEIPFFGSEGIHNDLPVLEHPSSASAESFRFAATALELGSRRRNEPASEGAEQPHTFLITSAGPREGKTVIAANLALAAARKGRSVLVIDADFGHQRLSELLRGMKMEGPGITEVVEAGLDLVSGTFSLGDPGPLHLLSRGQRPTNAPDFFSLPATAAFLAKAGGIYDLVIIDGPPMLHIAYASILAQFVDRIVVVTHHGGSVTRLEDLAQRLDLIGTPLAGYVYNGAPLRSEMTWTEGSLKDVLGEQAANGEA